MPVAREVSMKRPIAAAMLLVCLVPFLSVAARPAEPAIKLEEAVNYATAGDEKLLLDIAIPPGGGPFPCVVCFHGGAWRYGSRRDLSGAFKDRNGPVAASLIELLATRGFVAVSVGYRLAPRHKFPAMIEDARSAIRFLRANARNFKVDPDKVAALGFSAGGHLALLAGLCDKSAGFDVGENLTTSGRAQCVVDFFGPTDLALYARSEGIEDAYLVPVFGKECKSDPAIYRKASPLTYVTKDAPPILFLHGTLDLIVPIKHSELLQKALVDAGAQAGMYTVPLAGHGGWNDRDMARAQAEVFKFLDSHLKGVK
jgi:acetyl esterase/lipase